MVTSKGILENYDAMKTIGLTLSSQDYLSDRRSSNPLAGRRIRVKDLEHKHIGYMSEKIIKLTNRT